MQLACRKRAITGNTKLHSITSSARARIEGGIVIPSVVAVFRLTIRISFGRLLDGQIGRLGALEDLVDVINTPPTNGIRRDGDRAATARM
jgi:hypothetical protein